MSTHLPPLDAQIEAVKTAKATAQYWRTVDAHGRESSALDSLDCRHGTTDERRAEAIRMLASVQRVSVFKIDGQICIQ